MHRQVQAIALSHHLHLAHAHTGADHSLRGALAAGALTFEPRGQLWHAAAAAELLQGAGRQPGGAPSLPPYHLPQVCPGQRIHVCMGVGVSGWVDLRVGPSVLTPSSPLSLAPLCSPQHIPGSVCVHERACVHTCVHALAPVTVRARVPVPHAPHAPTPLQAPTLCACSHRAP